MSKNFTAQVDEIITKNVSRVTALHRESISEIIDQAQTPVAKGGRMRVDTGFLRASGQLSLSGMPTGPVRGDPNGSYEPVAVTLNDVEVGTTVFFGWTANYAKYREAYDGFLGGALQNWQSIVDNVAARIKVKIR